MEICEDVFFGVGRLGNVHFQKGFYAYVGSALSGLEARVSRHLRDAKKTFWHIDYLLPQRYAKEIIFGVTDCKKECDIANILHTRFEWVRGFGSSDCGCWSHLFYSESLEELKVMVAEAYKKNHLDHQFLPLQNFV